MKREFLNTLYFSSYTGAGALCLTSVDLVLLKLGGEFISEKKFSTRFTDFKKIAVFWIKVKIGEKMGILHCNKGYIAADLLLEE